MSEVSGTTPRQSSGLAATKFLKNLWDDREAAKLTSPLDLLRYRSNLLGEDLRITNFGGGNTSSKPGRCQGTQAMLRPYFVLNSSSFPRPLALAASAIAQWGWR